MQLFTQLRALFWGLVGNTVSWTPAMKKIPISLYHPPKDGNIILNRSQALFN